MNHHHNVLFKHLYKNKKNEKTVSKIGLLAISALATVTLISTTACQSTASDNSLNAQAAAIESPKNVLTEAIKKQRRSNYAYRTDVMLSNKGYRQALANATPVQLRMSDNPEEHCEHIHDEAYANLLERAELAGVSLNDYMYNDDNQYDEYSDEDYMGFVEDKDADIDTIDGYDESNITIVDVENLDSIDTTDLEVVIDDANKTDANIDDKANAFIMQADVLRAAYIECKDDYAQWQYSDDMHEEDMYGNEVATLPNYDNAHTKLDARKAELLDAYLLKPLAITTQGVYRPQVGQMSVMPTLQFDTRNLTSIMSHYLFFDAKQGKVYFWADTFAYFTGLYLDDQLGLDWHNKWLMLDLNDGSLPAGFGKFILKSHYATLDSITEDIAADNYQSINTNTLLNQQPIPESLHPDYLRKTPLVIERKLAQQQVTEGLRQYSQLMYDAIAQQYPALVDGSSYDEQSDIENKSTLNSRMLVQKMLQGLQIAALSIPTIDEDSSTSSQTDVSMSESNTDLDYAAFDTEAAENKWVWRDIYGLDNRKQVQWHLRQRKLNVSDADNSLGHIKMEMFTQYTAVTADTPMFPSLPDGATTPNTTNTVDIKNYISDIKARYEAGEGNERLEMLIEGVADLKVQLPGM